MREHRVRLAGLALAAACAAGSAAAAGRPWVEVRTRHFTVVGNVGEGTARDVGWQFEQARAALKALWPWARVESHRPFVVLAVRDERDLRELAPRYWTGGREGTTAVFVAGWTADYVALRTDVVERRDRGVNPWGLAFEGYADIVLLRTFEGPMPQWFREGLRETFGNTPIPTTPIPAAGGSSPRRAGPSCTTSCSGTRARTARSSTSSPRC